MSENVNKLSEAYKNFEASLRHDRVNPKTKLSNDFIDEESSYLVTELDMEDLYKFVSDVSNLHIPKIPKMLGADKVDFTKPVYFTFYFEG